MTDFSLESLFAIDQDAYDAIPGYWKTSHIQFHYNQYGNLCLERFARDGFIGFLWDVKEKQWISRV